MAQFLGIRITGSKTLSVNLTQRADEGVSVLVADFTVVVAVAIVETCLAHAALVVPRATASSRRDQMAILSGVEDHKGALPQRYRGGSHGLAFWRDIVRIVRAFHDGQESIHFQHHRVSLAFCSTS